MPLLTRERILETALEIVETDGFENLSLRRLASTLDVTAPALYDHVESKGDLLRQVAELGYHELVEATTTTSSAAIDQMRERCLAYVHFAGERPELFRLMFHYRPDAIAVDLDNELPAASEAWDVGVVAVRQAIADGDIADRDPGRIAVALWAATHGVANLGTVAPALAETVAADVVDALLAGLRP